MSEFNFVDDEVVAIHGRSNMTDPILIEFAKALKENPGRWAQWPIEKSSAYISNIASRIRNGNVMAPALFRQGFDARVSNHILYVRFIGDGAQ